MDAPVILCLLCVPGLLWADDLAPKDLWLLGLFPFNGSWPGGLGQAPAVQMGIEDVNADKSILPGYKLHMTINNTQVSRQLSLKIMSARSIP